MKTILKVLMSNQGRFEQTEVWSKQLVYMWLFFISQWKRQNFCVAETISKFQKKIVIAIFFCVSLHEINLKQSFMACNKRIEVIKNC